MIQGKKTTYRDSGVNIEASDLLVKNIKALVGPDPRGRARAGIGGFAALYEMDDERLLASATDGVGTKLKWAFLTGEHRAVGLDLVAMSVNDILCVGATPLFFLDYLATGKLEVAVGRTYPEGVVEGCRQSKAFLIGGETAEMPGMYRPREYDLAGFAVGEVSRKDVVDGSRLKEGDTMVGLASSGLHANGFSLARRLIAETEMDIIREAMAPTVIYTSVVGDILSRGLATGLGPHHGWRVAQHHPCLFPYGLPRRGHSFPGGDSSHLFPVGPTIPVISGGVVRHLQHGRGGLSS